MAKSVRQRGHRARRPAARSPTVSPRTAARRPLGKRRKRATIRDGRAFAVQRLGLVHLRARSAYSGSSLRFGAAYAIRGRAGGRGRRPGGRRVAARTGASRRTRPAADGPYGPVLILWKTREKLGVNTDPRPSTGEVSRFLRFHAIVYSDSARWEGFEHRSGDIVISTPPKCGTTWTQMLCALLIFDGPRFPAPLGEVSPWLDSLTRPVEEVRAIYAAQRHRRFIKTHTPLHGLPLRDDVTYVVVDRDPRDVAISMEHHLANMDFGRFLVLRARTVGAEEAPPSLAPASDAPTERFLAFVEGGEGGPVTNLEKVLHHLDTAWQRRDAHNVALFHFADYRVDLPGEMLRLARVLGVRLDPARAAGLAAEAGLERRCVDRRLDDGHRASRKPSSATLPVEPTVSSIC